jgi:hypothetical protein
MIFFGQKINFSRGDDKFHPSAHPSATILIYGMYIELKTAHLMSHKTQSINLVDICFVIPIIKCFQAI